MKIACFIFNFFLLSQMLMAQTKPEIQKAQQVLKYLGYSPGPLDGAWGATTRKAVLNFQLDAEIANTGQLDSATMQALLLAQDKKKFVTACVFGSIAEVDSLIKRGVDVNSTDKGLNSLGLASYAGRKEIVQLLITNGADINIVDDSGETALLLAADTGNIEIAELLLKAGADISKRSKSGVSAIDAASQKGHYQIVKLLIEHRVDVNGKVKGDISPLYVASQNGHADVVGLLLENKANPNSTRTKKHGKTALITSIEESHTNIATLLIKAGANVNEKDNYGQSPLHWATSYSPDLLSLLIEKGANINLANDKGQVPLHYASGSGQLGSVEILIQKGAYLNTKDNGGAAPLHLVSDADCAALLLKNGAIVDDLDTEKFTPLHYAAFNNHLDVAKKLVAAGADKKAKNINGDTPLDLAIGQKNTGLINFLKGGK